MHASQARRSCPAPTWHASRARPCNLKSMAHEWQEELKKNTHKHAMKKGTQWIHPINGKASKTTKYRSITNPCCTWSGTPMVVCGSFFYVFSYKKIGRSVCRLRLDSPQTHPIHESPASLRKIFKSFNRAPVRTPHRRKSLLTPTLCYLTIFLFS